MKNTLRKLAGCTLALTGVLGVVGAGWYISTPAQASSAAFDVALSSLTPTATNCQTFRKNQDDTGKQLALLKDGKEADCKTALLTVPSDNSYASVYFVDVQENGYQHFQADVGLHSSVRDKVGEVEFKVFADGKQVYTSGTITTTTPAKHVDVNLADVEVLQLVVDAKGSNANDLAVWGDAQFTKAGNTPYLAVDDLEFNRSWQVTKENILEYVVAKDASGHDLSDQVTYQTDYKGQEKGDFHVTYTVADQDGNSRSRTVNLAVTGEDYTKELSPERLRQPWASYLYHGRGTLDSQGKKAWDQILAELLNFDAKKWKLVNHWGEEVYEVDVDLQANHIFSTRDQLTALGTMFMDDEPRTFILKDWGCEVTTKDGLASHVKLWVSKQALRQDEWLKRIEGNAQKMLAHYKPDMTEAGPVRGVQCVQRLAAV